MAGFTCVLVALALAQADAAGAAAESPAPPPSPTPSATPPSSPTSPPSATPTSSSTPAPTPSATPSSTPVSTSASPADPGAAPRRRVDPAVERGEAERVARAFLAALAAGSADGLAAAAAERFSFDGDVVAGREPVRSAWRSRLAGRPGPAPRPGALEVLAGAEALSRHGPPPARLATLARTAAFVAVGDVGGRTVVLFLAREAGRMAVLGMHD